MGTPPPPGASHRLDGAFAPGSADRSDDALVRAFQGGDRRAFDDLVHRHSARVFRLVRRMTGREDAAEEVTQEVFVSVYRALPRYEARARFTTWLTSVSLNHARTWGRRQSRDESRRVRGSEEHDPLEAAPAAGEGPDRLAERRERLSAVHDALARLDPDDREIVVLRDLEGYGYGQIGESLGVPPGTVKSRLHRARLALRRILESADA